jgi:hypothetical protein
LYRKRRGDRGGKGGADPRSLDERGNHQEEAANGEETEKEAAPPRIAAFHPSQRATKGIGESESRLRDGAHQNAECGLI